MADNSAPVAIVAIIAIVIILVGAFYFVTGGTFNFNKSTTVIQPTKVETPAAPASKAP